MIEQQNDTGEKAATQNLGEAIRATRNRHKRESISIASKGMEISREQVRKIGIIDKTAPKIIIKAMEQKYISIHKAFVMNKTLQKIPEDERETYAFLMLEQELKEKETGTFKERQLAKKLSDIMSIARRNEKILTAESIDIYLKYNAVSLEYIIEMLGDEIFRLSEFKLIIQKRIQGIDW